MRSLTGKTGHLWPIGPSLENILLAARRLSRPPIPGLGAVDHVGIKVPGFAALEPMEPLGLRIAAVVDHPEVGLRIAFVEGAEVPLELIHVVSDKSPLATDGDGLHHVAYRVVGLPQLVDTLQGDARFVFDGGVRPGALGHQIATFRLQGGQGIAYELVEAGDPVPEVRS